MIVDEKESTILAAHTMFIIILIGYIPVKFEISEEKLNLTSDEYVVCVQAAVTGADWLRITEYEGSSLVKANKEMELSGEYFNFVDYSPTKGIFDIDDKMRKGSNIFVAYGNHLEEPIEDEFYENVTYTCNKWDIVYPIQRYNAFKYLLPKSYLCIFDVICSL